jgi:hypothetical protein
MPLLMDAAPENGRPLHPELYARVPGEAQVFVSSQLRRNPLRAERKAAAAAIEAMGHRG